MKKEWTDLVEEQMKQENQAERMKEGRQYVGDEIHTEIDISKSHPLGDAKQIRAESDNS